MKYFLDTSAAYPVLLGTARYRKYFFEMIGEEKLYVSPFVYMEFMRNFIASLIDFYFFLNLPTIESIADCLDLWSNNFKTRQHKAIANMFSQLFQLQSFSVDLLRDKTKALIEVARLIKLIEQRFRNKFINNGIDSTRCERAKIIFNIRLENATKDFKIYIDNFNDVGTLCQKCRIQNSLLNRYRSEVELYISKADEITKTRESKGYLKIVEELCKICKNKKPCTCDKCSKIGDCIIALDAPRDMRLEHTDYSFDYLCPIISQPHFRHPSAKKVHNTVI